MGSGGLGSVLVADVAGPVKTRMGAHLVEALASGVTIMPDVLRREYTDRQ
jgi:hypothetical protein